MPWQFESDLRSVPMGGGGKPPRTFFVMAPHPSDHMFEPDNTTTGRFSQKYDQTQHFYGNIVLVLNYHDDLS
jgi:hypothetical protein